MNFKCAIMQPTYLPWLGYFAMIDQVDKFVFLDNIQLTKRSWQVRNKIKSSNGELIITVPIINKKRNDMIISEVEINYNENWMNKHLNSFKHNYSKAKYFDDVYKFIENIYMKKINNISDLNIEIIKSICKKIGVDTEFFKASELDNIYGNKDELLVSICKSIESDYYLSALGSYLYIEKDNEGGYFSRENISIEYQNYNHPKYTQLNGEFLPYISIIDLLFNYGFDETLDIIRKGNCINFSSKYMREKLMED